ncbi:MAG: hypothetical protein ABIO44_07390 [Saprospiraceae bacterium]
MKTLCSIIFLCFFYHKIEAQIVLPTIPMPLSKPLYFPEPVKTIITGVYFSGIKLKFPIHQPFFCKLEHDMCTKTKVKASFRLGTLEDSNLLEYGYLSNKNR